MLSQTRAKFKSFRERTRWFLIHRVLHVNDPPHELALGAAIGMFVAFTPTIGLQMFISVFFAWLLRANKAIGIPIVWISNPVTFVPIYYPIYLFGAWMTGIPPVGEDWWQSVAHPPQSVEGWWANVRWVAGKLFSIDNMAYIGAPLMLGCLVMGAVTALPTYGLVYGMVRSYRMQKWGSLVPPEKPCPARRPKLILASQSPRRLELLKDAGYPVEAITPPFDDTGVQIAGLSPSDLAVELATRKAKSVAETHNKGLILGCDTLVALDDRILGKPANATEARAMIQELVNAVHQTITGLCIIDAATGQIQTCADTAIVRIGPVPQEAIDAYLNTDAWQGKAGGYNLKELQDQWPIVVEGDSQTVIGLPIQRLEELLTPPDTHTSSE